MKRVLDSKNPEETRAFAAELAAGLKPGAILLLTGDYGSGKTTFVQGMAAGLSVPDLRVVCSPTFVMLNVYRGGRVPFYHMDATRLDDPAEVFRLGWEEDGAGVTAIEWGEKVEGVLKVEHYRIGFEVTGENRRKIRVSAPRKAGK